jgi:hypothetical protein
MLGSFQRYAESKKVNKSSMFGFRNEVNGILTDMFIKVQSAKIKKLLKKAQKGGNSRRKWLETVTANRNFANNSQRPNLEGTKFSGPPPNATACKVRGLLCLPYPTTPPLSLKN